MNLKIYTMVVGASQNNVVFLVDETNANAVVIDPSFDPALVVQVAKEQGWTLKQVWLTHGHYDHTAGVAAVSRAFEPTLPIAMSQEAFDYSCRKELPAMPHQQVEDVPQLDIPLKHGDRLAIDPLSDENMVEVRDVSGHSPGSMLFYVPELEVAIVGDAIFRKSIGRTDLPGSDHKLLLKNLRKQVFTLPEQTVLIPGHGPNTTVGYEKANNPYLKLGFST
jgi:hydroxyacylglutathione hydrolase